MSFFFYVEESRSIFFKILQIETVRTEFFQMVLYMLKNGLKPHAYTLRARILSKYFEIKESDLLQGLYTMNCNYNAGGLCIQLFRDFPSFVEKAKCTECNFEKFTNLTGILIEDVKMKSIDLNTVFKLDNGYCYECESLGTVVHTIESIGKLINNFLLNYFSFCMIFTFIYFLISYIFMYVT